MMNGTPPYAAPPRLFEWSGRLDRIRYLNHMTATVVGTLLLLALSSFLLRRHTETLGYVLSLLAAVPALLQQALAALVSVRRLRDLGRSPAWVLVLFVPFVGLLFQLWLLLWPGDANANRYGPPPPPAGPRHKLVAGLVLAGLLALFAAIYWMGPEAFVIGLLEGGAAFIHLLEDLPF